MSKRKTRLKQILIALVIALIVRVLVVILMEYRFYFPPDFDRSFFLAGRRPTFAGWYAIGFYAHIISGPIAIVMVVMLLVTGKVKRFKSLHRWSGRLLALITVLAVCPGGMIMATRSQAGPIAGWGFGALAICTLVSVSFTAVLAIKKQFKSHSVWAWRTGILLCSPILLRLATGVFYVTGVESLNTYRFLAWGSWLLPLLVFEGVRQSSQLKGKAMAKQVKRSGMTLWELLIVLLIIGVLLAMLGPCMREVRRPARRSQCLNNLRQLILAAHNYESAHMKLPMGVGVKDQNGVLQAKPLSGLVSLLPFIELENLHDEIVNPVVIGDVEYPAFGGPLSDAEYLPWKTQLENFVCPSAESTESSFGRTSYAFSLGDVARNVSQQETLRGAFGYFKANRLDDIPDGSSNTIGMLEIGGGKVATVNGGCLADGKSDWLDNPKQAFAVIDGGKYLSGSKLIDRGSHWADGRAGVGLVNTIFPANSPSFQVQGSSTDDGIYSAGSMHNGVCNAVFLDGSTHAVSDDIDAGDAATAMLTVDQMAENVPSPHGVWGALGTIGSGEVADWQ